ncbi:hypothetical protein [uncultured Zobellia sp.]|uniref:hypothetical protein n=1 Tax=uncultured Zobellia sp. TaxID=255433 RepID=UPI00259336C2|nr:hypothetical protein [uncultured Zobellia sp.]
MGLYLLNLSVDPADPNPAYIPEDLTINDQESIVEIIIEKILGYENAIEECDDNDTTDHNKNTNLKIEFIANSLADSSVYYCFARTLKHQFPDYNTHLTNGYQKLATPPPKA